MTKDNDQNNAQSTQNEEEKTQVKIPGEVSSVTHHKIRINGQEIAYTATAGTLILKEEDDEENEEGEVAKASIFYVAYTKDGVEDPQTRPLTFSFNGGPGSSSVWLHLGVLGPRRVVITDEGHQTPPGRLVDNEYSLLDKTDLVFIDPVSTGYSRAVPGEKPKQFHDVKKDIESVGEFIRLYSTRAKRWASPKFLIGESYGTTRAAGLSGYLLDRHGMHLNGIMLVSCALNFLTLRFNPGNDLPNILFLPTYAATAWYHKKLSDELQKDLSKTLAEVEEFTSRDYTLALMQGDLLAKEDKERIAQRLSAYTGLSTEYLHRTNLRIEIQRFIKELLREQRQTVGRLDSRFTGVDRDAAGEKSEFDPSYSIIQGPYTSSLNHYVRTELAFESDLPYEILTGRVQPWSYDEFQNQYVNVAETLRNAISKNPKMRVFVANGYYDLATPYYATKYTFAHLELDEGLQSNISMSFYEAGHMMYIHQPSLVKLKSDLSVFIDSAV